MTRNEQPQLEQRVEVDVCEFFADAQGPCAPPVRSPRYICLGLGSASIVFPAVFIFDDLESIDLEWHESAAATFDAANPRDPNALVERPFGAFEKVVAERTGDLCDVGGIAQNEDLLVQVDFSQVAFVRLGPLGIGLVNDLINAVVRVAVEPNGAVGGCLLQGRSDGLHALSQRVHE